MNTCSAHANIVFNDENRKTNARRRVACSIFFPWADYIQELSFCARSAKKFCGKQFSKLFKEFFPTT